MKTLDDYLATSSSGEEADEEAEDTRSSAGQPSGTSPVASPTTTAASPVAAPSTISGVFPVARTPTTAMPQQSEARHRQDEMRERMARLLGQDTVSNIAASVASGGSEPSMTPVSMHAAGSAASPTMPFPAVTLPGPAKRVPPPAAGPVVLDQTARPDSPDRAVYDRVEVMVVDRGTQTVTTVGTQTEPVWSSLGGQPQPPPPSLSMYMEPVLLPGRGFGTPAAGAPVSSYVRAWSSPPIGSAGLGVDGRPYRQLVDDLAVKQAGDATALREQLDMIQNSIDMLISRYNLPPPP